MGQPGPPASSVEVLEAFKELVQMVILVNAETGAMDIEEVNDEWNFGPGTVEARPH